MTKTDTPARPGEILLVLGLASFLVPFMGSSLNLALPRISEVFSFKTVALTWMATSYLIASAIFQIPFARIADLVGRRKIFIWGVAAFSVFTILSGLAPTGWVLIVLRALSGVSSAMMFGTSMAILTSSFPANRRGWAMGINTAVVYSSLAAGPFLGGLLTHYWGWQSVFFVCGAVGIVVVILAHLYLRHEWVARGETFDWVGSLVYGLGLFGLIYGFTRLPTAMGFVWIAVGTVAFVSFVGYEKQCPAPVFDVRLFSGNRVFALSSLSALINYASNSAVAFMLSLYLQYLRGFDARTAGLILISQACVQSLCSLYSGRLSDRVNAASLATIGMGVSVCGLTGLFFVTAATPVYMLIGLLALLGIGFGIFSSPNTNVIMSSVDVKQYGQASASTGTMRLTGQAVSMGIAGMAVALQVGNKKITPEVYPQFLNSVHITFGIFAVLCLVGVYASLRRKRGGEQPCSAGG
ncbi:MAG: MFS transporter [Rikenellaceae bacterium]|jgi:MFS family permease|nr:MFS transporter [Rikenellaceae bacterium]